MTALPEAKRPSAAGTRPEPRTEVSLFDVVLLVLRRWRVVLAIPLVLAAITATVTILTPRKFVATASFMPQAGDADRSRLSGLAAQFGVALPTGRMGTTSAFYASLVRSRSILQPVSESTYVSMVGQDTLRGTLIDLVGPRRGTPAGREEKTLTRLREAIEVSTQLETGIVRLSVSARSAILARGIAEQVLSGLSAFDQDRRRTQAISERMFIEQRVTELGGELREAEERQGAFMRRNRDFRNSPELQFENERLGREVSMRQQVYTSFAQAYEQARVDEVRNTPVLSIIERPDTPAEPQPRGLVLRTMLSLVLGFLAALGVASAVEFVQLSRTRDPEGASAVSSQVARTRAEVASVLAVHKWKERTEDGGRGGLP